MHELHNEFEKESELVDEASLALNKNVEMLVFIAGITQAQQRKLSGSSKIVEERV